MSAPPLEKAGSLGPDFENAAARPRPRRRKRPSPTSIRFSEAEKARLREEAGGEPLGAYIRAKALGPKLERRRGSTIKDYEKLAMVLAALGQSHLASNMNQLAKAANIGTLPVTLEVVQELLEACRAIREMREALIAALGVKPERGE